MKRRSCNRIADVPPRESAPGMEPGCDLLARLRPFVRQCGDRPRPAWRIAPRRLLDYLLVYIAEGRGRFVVAGRAYEAVPGDLFWIPPDTLHEMEGFAPGMRCPYAHFDLLYQPDRSHWNFSIPGGATDLSGLRRLRHPPVDDPRLRALRGRIRGPTNRRVGQGLREICAEAARAQPYAVLRMSGLMLEILAEILRGRAGLPLEYMAHIPLLEEAADDMARRCAEPLRQGELARRCELSPGHFRHLFGRHFGCAPRTYLRRARVRLARELMIGTPATVSEIAARTGFGSVHSLSRAFRAEEGLSPSQYRRCAPPRIQVEGRRTV